MSRSYQDLEPDCQYKEGEAQYTIEFHVKHFRKDQLRVHFGSNNVLTVSGERPLEGSKWTRFRKEFTIPKDCKANEIRARFSSGFLYITIPKKIAYSQQDSLTPMQSLPPVEDKGKLKQENNISQSREAAGEGTTGAPTENAISPQTRPKWFISKLKMESKTAMKIGASLTVAILLFIVLFYAFKLYDPMIMNV
ncbi:hypothetical protein CXB51_028715 [Gossypium anomalum]|uniref:SHSP domain-containing protein n=1 Tax=Gossypium anomalum TaxID=47600 RepID=A0A8J6CPV9_9ROSI|nr:hypothetical protein CXB51_028715 [Gossypium anomalum]